MKFTIEYEVDFEVGPIAIQGTVEIEIDAASREEWDWDFAPGEWKGDNPQAKPSATFFDPEARAERDETFQTALRAHLERSDHFHDAMTEAVQEEFDT